MLTLLWAAQLAGYLLSEEGEPLLNALSDRLVEELDVLGADSAVFTYSAIVSLGRQLAQSSVSGAGETLGIGNATASGGGRSDAFLEAALGTVSTTLSAIGSGKWELAATSFEEVRIISCALRAALSLLLVIFLVAYLMSGWL